MTDEQKEFLKNEKNFFSPEMCNRAKRLFGVKPERVKKYIEMEFDDIPGKHMTQGVIDICIREHPLFGKDYIAVNPTFKEITDKTVTNPTPEREGIDVRIEVEGKKFTVEEILTAISQFIMFRSDRRNLTVKEIGDCCL